MTGHCGDTLFRRKFCISIKKKLYMIGFLRILHCKAGFENEFQSMDG